MFIFSLRPCIYSCCRQRVFMWTRNATRTENQKWRMGLLHPGKALHGHLPRCQNFCPCSSPEARSYSVQTQLTDSAATHSPHRTNRRQKRTQNVERVVAFLLEKGTLYPDARELGEFMRGLGGGMNKDTKRTQIMRQMKRARQMARAQHMHPGSHERHNFNVRMTTKQKQLIRDHIEVSPHPNNVPLLCDELQPSFTRVSRKSLYDTILKVIASKCTRNLSDEVKESVRKHVATSSHPDDFVQLCDELEAQLDLGQVNRTALYGLVVRCSRQHLHVRMTTEQKQEIRHHIESSPHPHDISLLCDELQPSFDNVPRKTLYDTVLRVFASKSTRSLSEEVKENVRKHVANSPHPENLVLLRNELESQLGLDPVFRTALYDLVRRYSGSRLHAKLSTKEKQFVRDHIKKSPHSKNIPLLRSELEAKLGLDREHRTALYHLISNCIQQHSHVKMTAKQKHLIRQCIQKSPHPNNIPLLCDELQPSFDTVSRHTLLKTIRKLVTSKSARALPDEVKENVRQHVANSPHPENLVLLCDELEAKLGLDQKHRTALYHLISNCSRQHLHVRLTTEQKQLIREHVENSPHPSNIPLLCDELQPLFAKVSRYTLYQAIRRIVVSKSSEDIEENVRKHVTSPKGSCLFVL